MQYVEDIWPRSVLDDKKFRTFLELCKIRDDFLTSLTTVRYYDYLIDKKLIEAGGLGKTVYIYPARGTNRNILCKRILEFLEYGRDVQVVYARDAFTKPHKPDWYNYLNDQIKDKLYEEFRRQLVTDWTKDYIYPYEFKPIVRPDAYIYGPKYSNNYMFNKFLWGGIACDVLKDSIIEIVDSAKGEK